MFFSDSCFVNFRVIFPGNEDMLAAFAHFLSGHQLYVPSVDAPPPNTSFHSSHLINFIPDFFRAPCCKHFSQETFLILLPHFPSDYTTCFGCFLRCNTSFFSFSWIYPFPMCPSYDAIPSVNLFILSIRSSHSGFPVVQIIPGDYLPYLFY